MKRGIFLVAALVAAVGCGKKSDNTGASAAPVKTSAPVHAAKPAAPPPPAFDVPFQGTFKRTAKVAFKNGQKIRTESVGSTASITIEPGKVTYHVEYSSGGKPAHVTEHYTFQQSDMVAAADGYDVKILFAKMDSDTKTYNPDSNDVKIEARKQTGGWEIGFLYHDTGGIQGGEEFH